MQWGGERLYRDDIFPREGGRALLHCVPCLPFTEQPDAEYSFTLNTGPTVKHWHTRPKTGVVPMLNGMVPDAWLEMNSLDATRLDLRQHDRVDIVSRSSTVQNVELRVTGIITPGQVLCRFNLRSRTAISSRWEPSIPSAANRTSNNARCAWRTTGIAGEPLSFFYSLAMSP